MVFLDWRFSRLDSAWRMFCSRHSDLPMTPWPREYGLFPLSHKGREKNSGARNISVRQTREAQYFTGGSTWNNWDALTMDSVHPSFFFVRLSCFCFLPARIFFSLPPFFPFRRVAIEKLIDTWNGARYSLQCHADFICNSKIRCFIKRDSQIRTYLKPRALAGKYFFPWQFRGNDKKRRVKKKREEGDGDGRW